MFHTISIADYTTFLASNLGSSLATLVSKAYSLPLVSNTPFPAFYIISTVITLPRLLLPN
jgi:hypothetical protein